MYGYVRPLKPQLKLCEYDLYKAVYCGLCHALSNGYGFAARFCVSYDMTFLYMLLYGEKNVCSAKKRCAASPFRKKDCICPDSLMNDTAAVTVMLAYHKLADDLIDGGFIKKLRSRVASLFLRRAYKKASACLPDFDKTIAQNLELLHTHEKNREKSIDRAADCFAKITAAAAGLSQSDINRGLLETVLYNTGRFIYIADALDDLKDDMKDGSYNPVALRWELETPKLSVLAQEELEFALDHTMALAYDASARLEQNAYAAITDNIIKLGMPSVIRYITNKEKKQHD